MVFALLAVLGLAATLLTREAAIFAGDLPRYEDNLRVKVSDVTTKLKRRGNLADGFGCP